jgi:hypothetical protein
MTDSTHSCGGNGGDPRRRARERRARRDRKERVLHTRISDDLAEDLRKMADDLRVPVSNIVRTVLEDAFSVVEKVSDNVGELIEEVVDEAEAASERLRRRYGHRRRHGRRAYRSDDRELETDQPEAREPAVLGWQPLMLARAGRCSDCGGALARGAQAWAAVTRAGVGSALLCEDCLRSATAADPV